MVARSRPSLRRSSRRGDQVSSAASVTESQASSAVMLSHRTKRNRISSISDAENLRKRRKIETIDYPSKFKFPLRNRPNNEPLRSLSLKIGTKPVFSGQEEQNASASIPNQKQISPIAKDSQQWQRSQSQLNDKRTLRSQDGGSRSKSELSLYFTNYEQMLSLELAKPGEHNASDNILRLTIADLLTAKTHITLIDDLSSLSENCSIPKLSTYTSKPKTHDPFGAQKPLHIAHRIDLKPANQGYSPRRPLKDTLPEDVFHQAHRKAERHEKQLRNIEKERAQHEKVQLDRLLEELKGPDWLKVMGISGVTESEKKLYEPKRMFFIKEVAGLIEKFRHWKEEEKRRKIEREQAVLVEEEGEEVMDEDEDSDEDDDDASEDHVHVLSHPPTFRSSPNPPIRPAPPNTNDVDDAAAARQLHQETISFSSPSGSTLRKKKLPPSSFSHAPPPNQEPGSFFAKRPMCDAAIAGHCRGPNKLAFGALVPDPEPQEFQLPGSILTRDMIRARARLRRRLRRGSPE